MKRVLLLTTIGVLFCVAFSAAQNVFDPADPIVRYSSGAALGTPQHPDPNVPGLQKWVSVASSGVSTGSNSFDASSYKAYFINRNGGQTPFRLKFPKSYTNPDSAGKIYPIMIFFHGAGEPGCPSNGGIYNNERQLLHGGKLFRDRVDNNEFDGFLLYPQNLAGSNCWGTWGGAPFTHYYDDIIAMIDSMAKYARADVNRVLTTGLSDGGAAAWGMMTAFPQRVAKAAPSSAATGATNFADFVHIPIWFASGGKDSNPTPGFAGATYNNIKAAGADIIYTLFPDLGHSVWYDHWQLPGFVAWMNDMNKANPLVYFQRYDFCPDSTINTKIGITRGFAEYEWRKDGVLIATATRTGSNYPYTYSTNIIQPASIISFTANDITVRSFGTYSVRFRRNPGGPWSV
ncbi:MAG TPA: hypothetical protein VFS31_06815, partial [Chitinophagaceae bacterium]|nr:hypothetical protein [Chitinophagaceae bacterium]